MLKYFLIMRFITTELNTLINPPQEFNYAFFSGSGFNYASQLVKITKVSKVTTF